MTGLEWTRVCLALLPPTQGEAAAGAADGAVRLTEALQAERLLGLVVGGQQGRLVHQDLLQGRDVSGGHQAAAHSLHGRDGEGLLNSWGGHCVAQLSLTADYSLLLSTHVCKVL